MHMRINKLLYTYAAHDRYIATDNVDARTRGRRIQHGRRTYLMDYLERRRTNQKKKRRRRSLQRRKPKKKTTRKGFILSRTLEDGSKKKAWREGRHYAPSHTSKLL